MGQAVLLIAPDPAGTSAARFLRSALQVEVCELTEIRSGVLALRREDYTLVLLDENLAAADTQAAEALYLAAGTSPVLALHFAISRAERVARQVKGAFQRRTQDEAKARSAAALSLGNELNASLTGLLLESQLALRDAGPELAPALRHLIDLAGELRAHLRS